MNPIVQVDESDFTLQSLSSIGSKLIPKRAYVLLVKSRRCGFCITYYPFYERFAMENPDVTFLVLEASDNTRLLQSWSELDSPAYTVGGYPTVIIYDKNGHPHHMVDNRMELGEDIKKMPLM